MEELEEVEIEEEVRSMEESSRIRTEGIVEEVKREVIESRYEITILRLRNTDSEGETHVILKRADEETNYQWEEGHILSISGLHPQKIDGREYLMSSPTTVYIYIYSIYIYIYIESGEKGEKNERDKQHRASHGTH